MSNRVLTADPDSRESKKSSGVHPPVHGVAAFPSEKDTGPKFWRFLRIARIACATGLILVSLWALLLPPLFPYSTHAIVNAKVVTIRARDEGQVSSLPAERTTLVKAGDRVASVKRDLEKVQRDLQEKQFTEVKLKEQLESLGAAIGAEEKKLQEAQGAVAASREGATRELQLAYNGAVEKVRIYTEEVAEKKANQQRVAPLFKDGIVTGAQWSETRQQTIDAEKNLTAAEAERDLSQAKLDGLSHNAGDQGGIESVMKRMDGYEEEISSLKIKQIELNADLKSAQNQIALIKSYKATDLTYDLTSPIEGIVWRNDVVNGENLSEGEDVVDVADTHSMFIEAYLGRDFVNSIAVGDRATVYLLAESRFITGRVTDIQVQQRTDKAPNIVNTVEMDASVLRVSVEVNPAELKPDNIGQLAKVVLSSGKTGVLERGLIWLSLLLQRHG